MTLPNFPAGIDWQALVLASLNLQLAPVIGEKTTPNAKLDLALTPQIGMMPPALLNLILSPSIGAGVGAETGLNLAVTPKIQWFPSTALNLVATPTIGVGGSGISTAVAGMSLTPSIGMTGVAPPVFDAVGAGVTGAGTAKVVTETHLLAASVSAIVVGAHVGGTSTGTPTVTAKIGTTTIPQLGSPEVYFSPGTNAWQLVLFGLISPPTGSQTITVTCSAGTNDVAVNSVSYFDVSSFGTVVGTSGTGTSPSHTVTSAANKRIFQMFGNSGTTAGAFSAYNQTSRYNKAAVSSVNGPTLIGDAPGAASVVFSATTASTPNGWGSIAVPMNP